MVLNNGVVQGSHGHRRVGFPWMCVWGSHGCACGVPMDVRAGLTRGSYRWRTRDPWMMHNEVKGP